MVGEKFSVSTFSGLMISVSPLSGFMIVYAYFRSLVKKFNDSKLLLLPDVGAMGDVCVQV